MALHDGADALGDVGAVRQGEHGRARAADVHREGPGAEQLGAQLVYCESTREECLARAKERGVFAADWEKYVRRWWNEYEP